MHWSLSPETPLGMHQSVDNLNFLMHALKLPNPIESIRHWPHVSDDLGSLEFVVSFCTMRLPGDDVRVLFFIPTARPGFILPFILPIIFDVDNTLLFF